MNIPSPKAQKSDQDAQPSTGSMWSFYRCPKWSASDSPYKRIDLKQKEKSVIAKNVEQNLHCCTTTSADEQSQRAERKISVLQIES